MDASYLQTSFLGGQWSTSAQGRADEEGYRTALNRSFNALPIEAGAHTRRPGTAHGATTRHGLPGVLREFHFSENAPFNLEFTDNHLRIWAGSGLMLENEHAVSSISTASPAVLAVPAGYEWASGDEIEISATPIPGTSPLGIAPIFNRQFSITTVDATHVSISDPVTGAPIDGSTINTTGWVFTAAKVVDFATAYVFGEAWLSTQIRVVQDEDTAFVLAPGYAPMVLQNIGSDAAPVFQWTTPVFLDGPYLDPPTDASTLTPSGTSGTVTLAASAIGSINSGAGFQASDVGRFVRLLSEPLNWSSATAYHTGDKVRFETGAGPGYYQALLNNTNVQPDLDDGVNWAISTTAAAWTWAIIQTVVDTSHVTATLQPSKIDVFQQPLAGGSLLYTNPVTVWRLGAWSNTLGWPTCGGFHEGRFYFSGVVKNRFDATMSNEDFNFAPTLLDGTVADNCGLDEVIKAKDRNTVFWISPAAEGLILGTQGGEWLVQASTLNEPITPTSVQAHKVTKYGCANVEPVDTGLSYVFVQRYQKQVYEYLADVYSRKFQGTNIARRARDLTSPGIVELAYTYENAPVIWARTAKKKLLGCTYKRESPFSTQPASFFGWHQHELGSGREVESLSAGPSPDGTIDSLALVTRDPVTGIRFVEFLTPVFEETDLITSAWFLDAAVTPASAEVKTVNSHLSVVFYGLQYVAGATVTAFIGGLDAGDYLVSASGTITVPIDGSANPLLTEAALAALNALNDFGMLGVNILVTPKGQGFFSPVGAALDYTTSSNAAAHGHIGVFDWDKNLFYEEQAWNGTTDPETNGTTLFVFDITTQAQIAGPIDPGEWAFAGLGQTCLGYDGNIYYGTGDSTHLVGRFNTTSHANDITYNDTHSLAAAGFCTPIVDAAGNDYVLTTGLNAGQGGGGSAPWYVVQMTGAGAPKWTGAKGSFDEGFGSIAPGNAFPCRGPVGRAYIGVCGQLSPWTGAAQLGLYEAAVDAPTIVGVAKVGSILATAVDAGWTAISMVSFLYDETDGNVLAAVTGTGNSNTYLIKLSTRDGSLMWSLLNFGGLDFRTSRVRGGRMSYVAGGSNPRTLYEIDTIAGTATAGPTESVIAPNTFSTDDTIGQVVVQINDIGTSQWATFGPANGGGAITPALYYVSPAVIGFNYISQGQILRPVLPQEAGSQNGPAQGKTRRTHMYSALLVNTQGIQVGTDFAKMRAARLVTAGRTQEVAANVLFTDVIQDTLEDTYSFHSMWAWQTVRPYPTTIASVECFLHTQDR